MIPATPSNGYVQDRRAIEALRSGVPNRDAVRALGCAQPEIEAAFRSQLLAATAGVESGTQAPGILVSGDFGSGKSHLLDYLMHLALDQRFVCSKIVISKETPLHDPAKLYRAAAQAAVVPDKKGTALTEIASCLDFNSQGCADFVRWVNRTDVGLNSRFPATVFLYERYKDKDPEVRDRIISFWSGDPLSTAELRRWLRDQGEGTSYRLEKAVAKDLWLARFRFVSRLMVAAGYSGWVLLVDEVELIGRYSFKQRAKSYAELGRWAGRLQGEACPGLATVFAITRNFTKDVLEDRNDMEVVPGKLRSSGIEADRLLASPAERGMRFIDREAQWLTEPEPATIHQAKQDIQEIHARAYGWSPPGLASEERLERTLMRQYVRRWINEWDLKRLYPEHEVHMIVEELKMDYSEDRELEKPAEDDSGELPIE